MFWALLLAFLLAAGFSSTLPAQSIQTTLEPFDELTDHRSQVKTIWVPLYKSHILRLHRPVAKISVGNAEIADILIMRADQLYVLGRGLGTTNVLLWDKQNKLISAFDVEVTHDLDTLKSKLYELLPNEEINVHSSQGAIVLSGQVTSLAKMNTAMEVARSFALPTKDQESEGAGGEIASVVNLLTVGGAQQVMLKVTVAEISRTVMKRMGIKFNMLNFAGSDLKIGAVSGGARFPDASFNPVNVILPDGTTLNVDSGRQAIFQGDSVWGPAIDEFAPTDLSIADKGIFASFLNGDFLFNLALDAAKENGFAKVLAEPTLTTLTGQEAKFLSGGEFPIPVPSGDNGVTIDYKEFGVGVKFIPVVLDNKRINLKLNIDVSELTSASAITLGTDTSATFFVPALTKRAANATVELADGQTIGIAGLINETMRDVVNKFPGLGDVPVLGHLFRSQEFEKGETELVILVTPQLAKPLGPDQISLPTDGFAESNDFEFYILGKTMRSPYRAQAMATGNRSDMGSGTPGNNPLPVAPMRTSSGGMEGQFGHSVN